MNPTLPDARGYFGRFGGQFVAETLMQAVLQLQDAYRTAQHDPAFWAQFRAELADYVGRPSPLYFAKRLTEKAGGAEIWLKREDLNHTGAHKINNTIGHCRNRRRTTRRGQCHHRRPPRYGMHRVHGCR